MKFINIRLYTMALMATVLILVAGCEKNEIPPIGERFSYVEGINDSWTLTQVIQTDKVTSNKDRNTLDVSDIFMGSTPMKINFNSSGFSYSVNAGTTLNLLGENGIWAFDDEDTPTKLTLTTFDDDIYVLELLAPVRKVENELKFEFVRTCRGEQSVGYQYIFSRD